MGGCAQESEADRALVVSDAELIAISSSAAFQTVSLDEPRPGTSSPAACRTGGWVVGGCCAAAAWDPFAVASGGWYSCFGR
jgi:hypothetical protein